MAEILVNSNFAPCSKYLNAEGQKSVKKYTFVNLKNKSRVLPTALKDGAIMANSSVACTSGGAMSNIVTSDPAVSTSVPPVKRFAKATLENISAMKERRFEVKTVKNTKWGVKIFRDWLIKGNHDREFENMLPNELDTLLAQ